jgi:hypothetical protein
MDGLIDTLKFSLLLRVTAHMLARARTTRFQEMLHEDAFVMQIRTERGAGGHFILADGVLTYRGGLHLEPDFEQTWRSAREAVTTMTSTDETAMNRALMDRLCRMRGRFTVALWFNEAVKIARAPQTQIAKARTA